MHRIFTLLIAALVTVAMVGGTPLVMAHDGPDEQTSADDAVQPGEQLAGVVGVQNAEFDGEMEERTYGIKIANAATENATADVVAAQHTHIEDRLTELEAKHAELEDAREEGDVSEGEYRATMATLAAEKGSVERMAASNAAVAGNVSADLLGDRGIDVEAIETLREDAHALGGDEISEIAQSIAGPGVGSPIADTGQDRIPIDSGAADTDTAEDDESNDEPQESPGNASVTNPSTE